jgi:signal transduction histidine kinase
MNIYRRRLQVKYLLFLGAILIGVGSLWYTNRLVEKLANEERKKVELWAKATNLIANYDLSTESLSFMIEVIQNNETVPVIIVDEKDSIRFSRNIDSVKISNPEYVARFLHKMRQDSTVIEIDLGNNRTQFLYYDRSIILTKLTYYPFVQLSVILLFIFVAYLAFSTSRRAEQNQVWVGLSKETAHQLGTPISSLMAWKEILKIKSNDPQLISELEKDVTRLEKITERFSKIGAKPKLKPEDINSVIESAVDYLKTRSSKNIEFICDTTDTPVIVPLNVPLFEWVLENVCKNAMDAIEGKGKIQISVIDNEKFVFIDIADNGKGIPRSKHKTIFKPGYTTKERGWGLGLSLTKRIVEEYHGGKIFVASSEPGKGTTFRITLNAITN